MSIIQIKCNGLFVALALALFAPCAQAQDARGESQYAMFVSQRGGTAELYLLDLGTRQVSQLTHTGRGHLSAALALKGNGVIYAAREGSNVELFMAALSPAWRTRRPQLAGIQRLTVNTFDEVSPSLSADGSFIAFASGDGIEFMTAGGGARQVLLPASEVARDYCPVISPDGTQIAFISNRTQVEEIWVHHRVTGELRILTSGAQPMGGMNWSADGRKLAFTTGNTDSKLPGVAIADIATGAYRVVSALGDSNPAFAPRGDRLLMTSVRDGDPELYLLDLNSGQATRLTHSAGLDDGAIFLPSFGMPARQP
jgi:TolB protein